MAFLPVIVCFVVGLIVSLAAIPFIQRFSAHVRSRNRNFHQTHETPISRFGGIAFAAAFLVVAGCAALLFPSSATDIKISSVIFFTSLAMFGVGFWDDLHALGATRKLLAQIVIASLAYFGGIQIQGFQVPLLGHQVTLGIFSWPVTVLWVVALTNLMNLIDGIDGLAAGVGLMLMGLLVVVGIQSGLAFSVLCAAGLAGAQLGFLRYNFPPAKIYMGDGGAYFIGFIIGLLTIINSQKGTIVAALIAPLFALALPIIDVATAIMRRGLKGLPIFRADRKHIHHQLLARGFSRKKTVLTLYILCLVCLVFAFAVFCMKGAWLPFLFGAFCLTLLLAGHSIDFSRDWLALGRVIGNSVDLRKDTRYALTLIRWLELEAERAETFEELWSDFEFVFSKLRFRQVSLHGALHKHWQTASPTSRGELQVVSYDMHLPYLNRIEFVGDLGTISQPSFELLSELAAEAWLKVLQRWQELHPVSAAALMPSSKTPFSEVVPVPSTSAA